jgi:hypothetical protein
MVAVLGYPIQNQYVHLCNIQWRREGCKGIIASCSQYEFINLIEESYFLRMC